MPSIKLDPEELMRQSVEMRELTDQYDALFASVTAELGRMNDRWSKNLANSFAAKIGSAGRAFSAITELLRGGADAAKQSAESFQSVDTALSDMLRPGAVSIGTMHTMR